MSKVWVFNTLARVGLSIARLLHSTLPIQRPICGGYESGYAGCPLEREAHHFAGIDASCFHKVPVHFSVHVGSEAAFFILVALNHQGAFERRIFGDLPAKFFYCAFQDLVAKSHLPCSIRPSRRGMQRRRATPRHQERCPPPWLLRSHCERLPREHFAFFWFRMIPSSKCSCKEMGRIRGIRIVGVFDSPR